MATPNGKAIDAAYLLTQLKNYDTQVATVKYNRKFQLDTMPTASAENVGFYVQYIGTTTAEYTNGYFYTCKKGEGETYAWEAIDQSAPEYTIKKLETPSSDDYAATYRLTKDNVEIGEPINIPKDFFVTDASTGVVTEADKAEGGKFYGNDNFKVGDTYIQLDVALKDKTEPKPVYINTSGLVDIYTAGDGINIVAEAKGNKVSANIAANGGLKLETVEGSSTKAIAIEFETVNIDFEKDWE